MASLPHVGKAGAQKLLADMQIAESRRVRGLGPHQRERLLEWFAPKT
ncbi:hypothetical protein [Streptomyces sp. NPDC055056]